MNPTPNTARIALINTTATIEMTVAIKDLIASYFLLLASLGFYSFSAWIMAITPLTAQNIAKPKAVRFKSIDNGAFNLSKTGEKVVIADSKSPCCEAYTIGRLLSKREAHNDVVIAFIINPFIYNKYLFSSLKYRKEVSKVFISYYLKTSMKITSASFLVFPLSISVLIYLIAEADVSLESLSR